MEIEEYKNYTISTILNYPLKYRQQLRALFLQAGIAQTDPQVRMNNPDAVVLSGSDLNQQLSQCITQNNKSLYLYEEWEFTKGYKYSVIFEAENFDSLLENVFQKAEEFPGELELYSEFSNPQLLKDSGNDTAFLKFNRKFEATHPQTGKRVLLRYPVIVVFHKTEKLIEIRFDALKGVFMTGTDVFYTSVVEQVQKYVRNAFHQLLIPWNMDFLLEEMQKEIPGVRLIAQSMKMANGNSAELQVGKNKDYVLPFIDELKSLLLSYSAEFALVPALEDALEQFIFEKERMSEYPWIELLWENSVKAREIQVKFTFDYYGKRYCLLHYFNSAAVEMERMNHVVRFIRKIEGGSQHAV